MSRRVSYSDVPYRRSGARIVSAPLVLMSNLVVGVVVLPAWLTTRVNWATPLEQRTRIARESGRPLIFYSWHAYEPFLLLAFRDVPESATPLCIGNDGLGSRLVQHGIAWFGTPVWIYRRRSPVSPTRQITDLLRRGARSVALVPDAGGPYGQVKPGIAEIARSVEAWLLPVVVRGRGRLRIARPWRYGCPLPFGSVDVHPGELLDGRTATVESCQRRLDELESRVGGKPAHAAADPEDST